MTSDRFMCFLIVAAECSMMAGCAKGRARIGRDVSRCGYVHVPPTWDKSCTHGLEITVWGRRKDESPVLIIPSYLKMTTVQQRIAAALERSKAARTADGKIKGKAPSQKDMMAKMRAEKRQTEGKPRSWKPVCPTPEAVRIGGYYRNGTKDGALAKVRVGSHCRNPPR